MVLKSNAFISLDDAKDHLDIPTANTDYDTRLERFINNASQWIETQTNRKFHTQTFTDYPSGRSSDRLVLGQWPITAITSIHIDTDSVFPASSLVDATTYSIDSDSGVVLHTGVFPKGSRNIKVVYVAGYPLADMPSDLVEVCYWLVEYFYSMRGDKRIGQSSKSKAGETTTYLPTPPKFIKEILDKYRRWDFPLANEPVENV